MKYTIILNSLLAIWIILVGVFFKVFHFEIGFITGEILLIVGGIYLLLVLTINFTKQNKKNKI